MSNIILSAQNVIDLEYIPHEYHEPFKESVLDSYRILCEGSTFKFAIRETIEKNIPDATEILLFLSDFYLIGAMFQESGDPHAFRDITAGIEDETEQAEIFESEWEYYSDRVFGHYQEMFMDDICSILNHYRCLHMVTFQNAFDGIRYYSINNKPVLNVW